jgi:hypothetical protein
MEERRKDNEEDNSSLGSLALDDKNQAHIDPPPNLPVTVNETNDNLPVADGKFFASLRLLQSLQRTILYERISIQQQDQQHLQLGRLNMLRPASGSENEKTRVAVQQEWGQVELGIMSLIKYLSPRQVWQVQLDQITGFLTLLPLISWSLRLYVSLDPLCLLQKIGLSYLWHLTFCG